MTERGDFATVGCGYAVLRAIPEIDNPGELRQQYGCNSSILSTIDNRTRLCRVGFSDCLSAFPIITAVYQSILAKGDANAVLGSIRICLARRNSSFLGL